MSRLGQPNGDDYPDAANKHLEDARVLHAGNRYDGAAYLSGYVIECSMKSMILLEGRMPERVHILSDLSADALRLAAIPGARTARYSRGISASHSIYSSTVGWKETIRYRRSGTISMNKASDWLNEADRVYQCTVGAMRLDGVV